MDLKKILCALFAVPLSITGCAHEKYAVKTEFVDATPRKISGLTAADKEQLQAQRAVVERLIADPNSREKYKTAAGKLGTINAILNAGAFKPDQIYELQCLGIVFGDALVQELKVEWVMVEDEYGRDPALRVPGSSGLTFPLTMISKRVERGEKVDVFALYDAAADTIESEIKSQQ